MIPGVVENSNFCISPWPGASVSDEVSSLHTEQSFLGKAEAPGTTKADYPCASKGIYCFTVTEKTTPRAAEEAQSILVESGI